MTYIFLLLTHFIPCSLGAVDLIHYTFNASISSSVPNTGAGSTTPALILNDSYTIQDQYLACPSCALYFKNATINGFSQEFTAYATLYNTNTTEGTWFGFSINRLFDIVYTQASVSLVNIQLYYPSNNTYGSIADRTDIFGINKGMPVNKWFTLYVKASYILASPTVYVGTITADGTNQYAFNRSYT